MWITRTHPRELPSKGSEAISMYWMNQKKRGKNALLLQDIEKQVKHLITTKNRPVLFLERLDYLIHLYGFSEVVCFLYRLHEELVTSDASLIVHTHPAVISQKERQLLALELKPLPKPDFFEQIRLSRDLFDILHLVKETDSKISFKRICKEFSITKATARKRVYELHQRKLIEIKKDGRSKIVELTPRGQSLL